MYKIDHVAKIKTFETEKGIFSHQNVSSQPDSDVEACSQRNNDPSTIMPPTPIGTTTSKKKGCHSCVIGATITWMYSTLLCDDIEDGIGKANSFLPMEFLSMLLNLLIIRRWSKQLQHRDPHMCCQEHKLKSNFRKANFQYNVQNEQMKQTTVRVGCSVVCMGGETL